MLLSSKEYKSWWEIQAEYENYKASLEFDSLEDIKEYIIMDYKLERSVVERMINTYIESKEVVMKVVYR